MCNQTNTSKKRKWLMSPGKKIDEAVIGAQPYIRAIATVCLVLMTAFCSWAVSTAAAVDTRMDQIEQDNAAAHANESKEVWAALYALQIEVGKICAVMPKIETEGESTADKVDKLTIEVTRLTGTVQEMVTKVDTLHGGGD
jgi:septal ring factor EnvC (AmiA/AmiB activator)